jgi:hypothetical protein
MHLQDDFNYDLLNSASAPPGAADLPTSDMLPTQDASLWQVHIAAASVSASAPGMLLLMLLCMRDHCCPMSHLLRFFARRPS